MNILNPAANWRAILAYLKSISAQRELTWEMARREFTDRYAGQALGIVWGFAHPVIVILVYIFIFNYVFKLKLNGAAYGTEFDYPVYILAGLVPWLAFAEVLGKAPQAIAGNAALVKQVIFPLEILPTKSVLASFPSQLILLGLLVLYVLVRFQHLPWTFALVPLLLGLQLMAMLGISFILAAVGAYFRDLKDMVQIFCLVNMYLMPVVYLPDWVPGPFRPILYLNPFSYQAWCFQDALFYGRLAHPGAWLAYALVCLLTLGIGYRAFNKLKMNFGNWL